MKKPFRKQLLFWELLILIPIFWVVAFNILIHDTASYDAEIWASLCTCGLPVAFIVIITLAVVK